ncbi:MAG: hypothetical protein NVS3B21_13030 [Acidimicrobiales bacterium]
MSTTVRHTPTGTSPEHIGDGKAPTAAAGITDAGAALGRSGYGLCGSPTALGPVARVGWTYPIAYRPDHPEDDE